MEYPSLDKPTVGAFRFNTDSALLEMYDGDQWTNVVSSDSEVHFHSGVRAICAGGYDDSSNLDVIDYVNMSSTGNFADFGNLTAALQGNTFGNTASRTRGLISGGFIGPQPTNYSNVIQFVTIASEGDALDFGDLSVFTGGQRGPLTKRLQELYRSEIDKRYPVK